MQTSRKIDANLGAFAEEAGRSLLLGFLALALLIAFAYQRLVITHPYQMDYGEAPLVDQAMRLAAGQNIYRAEISEPPYTISNYPPLYVAVLAVGVRLFGFESAFVFGRILSALCAWAAGLFIARIIHAQTHDRLAAWTAGMLFPAFPLVVFWSPLLRIDMLALALSLAGLYMLVREPVSTKRFFAAAVLLLLAIYTRQSYALAAPLAAFVWLVSRDWRQGLKLAAWVGGTALLLFLLLNLLTDGGFYFNIVTANVNEFRMDNLKYHWHRLRETAFVPLIFGVISLFLSRRLNPLWTLAAPYLVGAALSGLTIGKIGSNVNYLLELCAALSLAAGVVIAWGRAHIHAQSLRAVLLIALAYAAARMMHFTLQDQTVDILERRAAVHDLGELKALVAETQGPVLADEYMGMLSQLGRPLEIQPFEVTQLAWAGKWDQTPLLERIQAREFPAIIIYDKPWAKERWTQEMFEAIDESYMLSDIVAGNRVYVPYQPRTAENLQACPGAVWQLPGDATLGVKWQDGGLDFFGQGGEGKVPVYAVADGLLTRLPDWLDAVAIQHHDPLNPGEQIWSYYSGMSAANGIDSQVAEAFAPGVENVPVKAGQLLGYQGSWSGRPQWPMWIHVHFALMQATDLGQFPAMRTSGVAVDPSPYLGLRLKSALEVPELQPLNCLSGQ